MKRCFLLVALAMMASVSGASVLVADFENLAYPTGADYYNGSDYSGGYSEGYVSFENNFVDYGGGYTAWNGFSYSRMTDTVTPGNTNQYSAYAGSGYNSSSYCVAGISQDYQTNQTIAVEASFATESTVSGAYFTNTTYSALSILNGDQFATAFSDGDYYKLLITGVDSAGQETGTIEFYLADYRDGKSLIVDEWTWIDLSGLGAVAKLSFDVVSTDVGSFGMNTPAYFAMDNLVYVPEPTSIALIGLGGLVLRRRK